MGPVLWLVAANEWELSAARAIALLPVFRKFRRLKAVFMFFTSHPDNHWTFMVVSVFFYRARVHELSLVVFLAGLMP
jgi:hypothetical protein